MISNLVGVGVFVFGGFVIIVQVYCDFFEQSGFNDCIYVVLDVLDVDDVNVLVKIGVQICQWVMEVEFLVCFDSEICQVFVVLVNGNDNFVVVVCFFVIVEDFLDVLFVGQQEIFFNICGVDNVICVVKEVFVFLFNDCVIVYCVYQGFDYKLVVLFVGVQCMVCLEIGIVGVMFILDIEFGFCDVVFIIGVYGLGEIVVQGVVNFDEFYVYKLILEVGCLVILCCNLGSKVIKMIYGDEVKVGCLVKVVDVDCVDCVCFVLSDVEVIELVKQVMIIEKYYGCLMDIEWVKDGDDGKLYIVQVCLEIVKSCVSVMVMECYLLKEKGIVLVEGCVIGQCIGVGLVKVINDVLEMDKV